MTCPGFDPPNSAYGTPSSYSDWAELYQYNASVMLDAALNNVGLHLVRNLSGGYSIITCAAANATELATSDASHFLRAGGNWSRWTKGAAYLGSLPNNVTIYFPIWDDVGEDSGAPIRRQARTGCTNGTTTKACTTFARR